MSDNWKTTEFTKAPLEILDGDRGKNYPKSTEFKPQGYCLFLSAKNVTKRGFEFSEKSFISQERDSLLKKGKLERFDVVLTTRGTVGNIAYFNTNVPFENIRINSGMVILRPNQKELDSQFLYFFLKSPFFENQVLSNQSGSAQPQLPIRDLKRLKIYLPSLNEQKAIASILSGLDDKIENNLQMNKTLKEMAMALYKHWFVDFAPFQDGEFKDVEFFGINRPLNIPAKFEVVNLKKIINRFKSKNKYNQKNVFPKGEIRVFDQSSSRILGFHDRGPDFVGTPEDPFLIFGDHTCRMELVSENFSVGPNLIPFKPKNPDLTYLMYLGLIDRVKMNDYKRHWSELMLHQLVIPTDLSEVKKFNGLVRDNFSLIYENEIQNQTLSGLRDTLLPKLISGEVRVKDVEKTLSEVL